MRFNSSLLSCGHFARFNSCLQDLTAVADSLQNVTAVYHACYDLGIFWFESENIPYSRNDFIRYYQITKSLSRGLVALVKFCSILETSMQVFTMQVFSPALNGSSILIDFQIVLMDCWLIFWINAHGFWIYFDQFWLLLIDFEWFGLVFDWFLSNFDWFLFNMFHWFLFDFD